MTVETANASWHPAFMPNAAPSGDVPTDTAVPSSANLDAPPLAAPAEKQLHDDIESLPQSQEEQLLLKSEPEKKGSLWMTEDAGQDAADDWPVFEQPATELPLESKEAPEEPPAIAAAADSEPTPAPAAQETTAEQDAPVEETKRSAPTLGHTSNDSFTRTVSHEVNWDDEHDTEWTLSRTDTDPFKFMPPSDRTNSFPPVPPITGASTSAPGEEHPLPSNQAEDLMNEIENIPEPFDSDDIKETNNISTGFDSGFGDDTENDHQYVGRDASFTEHEAIGSRYEEGVPLISQTGNNGDASQPAHSFDNEGAGDDDFFSQIQNSNNDDFPDFGGPQHLERKSTMQVLGATNTSALSRTDTLGDMLEEDEEDEGVATQPTEPLNGMDTAPVASETTQTETTQVEDTTAKPAEDLATKWEQAFADDDDDDFLLDETPGETGESKSVDPAAFFGSDDEGFLEDDDEPQATAPPAPAQVQPAGAQGRYTPQVPASVQQQASASPYAPSTQAAPPSYQPQTATASYAPAAPHTAQRAQSAAPYNAQQLRPEPPKAQSFADRSKGGYTSPYDLPMEVVIPKKRASTQQAPRSPLTPTLVAPPRSSSMQAPTPPPPRAATSSTSPPTSSHSLQPPTGNKPMPALRNKESFFEELPIASKPRSASRHSQRIPSPSPAGPPEPLAPPTHSQLSPSPLSPPMASPPGTDMSRSASGGIPNLVPGERVNPYAPQPAQQQAPGIPGNARYSPAPPAVPAANGTSRPSSSSRYSPAPTGSRPAVPAFHSATAPPTMLPHLPRTSSPLAHFEVSREAPMTNGDQHQSDRRSSYSLEPRINRVLSLPSTREVEEEEDSKPSQLIQPGNGVPPESRYSPAPPMAARQTPPPPSQGPPMHSTLSPPKRSASNYLPQAVQHDSPPDNRFVPPPRSQTQSPGSSNGRPSSQPVPRPSSVHSPTSPRATRSFQPSHAPVTRPRGPSQSLNMVAPTDGRENDPLQRWKGAPIISWGVGGTIITSFPKNVPRYGISQTTPMIVRSPGEVHLKHVKDIQPLEERLAKFPGPLRGKSKKKETVAWLTAGIETLERDLPDLSFQTHLSHEQKRSVERVLLWKALRVFIEHDGVLEGTAVVDKAVRDMLAPGLTAETEPTPGYGAGIGADALQQSSATQMKADAVDSSTMDQIRKHLLLGDREKAVWAAVDKRLWGHAMLISNTVSPDLYKQVSQEFVRKEVNYPGHNNESIAALYKVFSGNFDDCVDELVPVHARAGFQLVNTTSTTEPTKDATEGLDKWRETLELVLSNRSPEDVRALNALGNLLSSYGRAEAAHICYLFARKATIFGGLDDTTSNFVLVGADHKTQGEQFAKETEALLLSEVYEYGLSLSGNSTFSAGVPHLAAYKLQHAMTLAEYGLRDKALQYCEAIAGSITAQTKRSPYHHPILETAVENLRARLRQTPKEESSSWISKPSMNKVSDTVWSRFNKFVAGDESDNPAAGGSAEGGVESGPFARLPGGTPTISRSPSVSNFEPIYGAAAPSFPVGSPPSAIPIPATKAASRYAPVSSQTPALASSYEPGTGYTPAPASVERSSNEFSRSPYEPRSSMDSQPGYSNGGYVPQTQGYTPPTYGGGQEASTIAPAQSGYAPVSPVQPPASSPYQSYEPPTSQTLPVPALQVETEDAVEATPQPNKDLSNPGYQPPSYGYEPPSMVPNNDPASQSQEETGASSYEPPTYQPYSYEPPSYNPQQEDDDAAEPKPKPKSFIDDDDDDDIPALKALKKPQEKSKSEKDKENEEMFRKAAEEDAKRAAAAQQQSKKGWGFSSWFGGSKKEASPDPQQPNKPIKAKLGEANNFVYDPDLKRWVNKAAGAETTQAKAATPPPPKAAPRSSTGTPPPPRTMTPPMGRASAPPGGPPGSDLAKAPSMESLGAPPGPRPPAMMRSVSNTSAGGPPSAPPSRPATSMSNASSIDDLLSAAGPRKPGAKKAKKGGRYVDVMAK